MKLVPDARRGWRWFSTWALALLAAFPLVWGEIPADAKAMIPEGWQPLVPSLLALAGLVGRFVDQERR